jgi:hypothetical protein
MRLAAKLTIFVGLSLRKEHLFCLQIFSTTRRLGEKLGQTDERTDSGHYVYR